MASAPPVVYRVEELAGSQGRKARRAPHGWADEAAAAAALPAPQLVPGPRSSPSRQGALTAGGNGGEGMGEGSMVDGRQRTIRRRKAAGR